MQSPFVQSTHVGNGKKSNGGKNKMREGKKEGEEGVAETWRPPERLRGCPESKAQRTLT